MANNRQEETPKEEVQKKEIRYLKKSSISGRNKMFKCDVMTGKISRIIPEKQHFRHSITNVITVEYYIQVEPSEFYTSATNLEDAKVKFQNIFNEIEQKIAEKGEFEALATQEQVIE